MRASERRSRARPDPWEAFPPRRLRSSFGWCPEPAGTWWARARLGTLREVIFVPRARAGPLGRRLRRGRGAWVAEPLDPGPGALGRATPGSRALGPLPCRAALPCYDERGGRARGPAPGGGASGEGLLEGRYVLGPRGIDLRVLLRGEDLPTPPPPPWGPWRGEPGCAPPGTAAGAAAVALFRTGARAWVAVRQGRLLHLALVRGGAVRFTGWIVLPEEEGIARCAATVRRYLAAWPTPGAERVRTLAPDPTVARLFGAEARPLAPAAPLPGPVATRPAALVAAGLALLAAAPEAEEALRPGGRPGPRHGAGPAADRRRSPIRRSRRARRTRRRRASRRRRSSGRAGGAACRS